MKLKKRAIIAIQQRANEHSANVFVRAAKVVRVGEVLEIKRYWGGVELWLKVDARKNQGTAWKTFAAVQSPEPAPPTATGAQGGKE